MCVGFRLENLHLILTDCKGRADLGNAYLGKYTRLTLLLPSNREPCMDFRLAYLHLISARSTGQGQGYSLFDGEYT